MTRDLDWGVPIPLDGWRDRPDKRIYVWFDAVIGYLSASIEWARRSGDPDAWRAWWQSPDAESYYFMGKDNIVFHSEIWPADAARLQRPGRRAASPGALGALQPADRGGVERVPDDGGPQVLLLPQRRHLRPRLPGPLRRRTRCATTWPWPARRTRTPTSPGPSSSGATTTSWSPPGATWSTARSRSRPTTSARSRRRRADRRRPRAARATHASAFAAVGANLGRSRFKPAIGEAMRMVGRGQQVPVRQAPWKLRETDPARMATILHVALQVVDDGKTMLTPFLPHSSQQVHEMLGGRRHLVRQPRDRARSTRTAARPTRCSPATTTRPPAGSRARSRPARRSQRADAVVHQARPVGGRRGAGPAGRAGP